MQTTQTKQFESSKIQTFLKGNQKDGWNGGQAGRIT